MTDGKRDGAIDATAELPVLQSAEALEAVPGFQLVRMLKESTLARCYECRHERSGQIVVVKVLVKDVAADRSTTQRILRENRVVAGLRSHPHIVKVVDVGETAGGPYVAFEKVAGIDLRARLNQQGRMPVADALRAVRDAARALEAASAVGVAHRDVKPSNIFLLDDGTAKLTDFSFAAPLSRLGGPPGIFGTPAFTAPELVKGAPADVRTDIYALGATLFQLVTARPLFEGATPDVLAAHQKKPVPSIATLVPDAGIAVVDILYRLLHKEPARRPQTATEVVKLLDEAVARASSGSAGAASAKTAASEPQWPTLAEAPTVVRTSSQAMQGVGTPNTSTSTSTSTSANSSANVNVKVNAGVRREERALAAGRAHTPSPFDGTTAEHELVAKKAEEQDPYRAQPTGVLGTLKQMSVAEIVQMLEIGKKSARIDVSDTAGPAGVLHVHDGQIVFATSTARHGSGVGEPAVVALCQMKDGFFRIHYEKEACERNVTRPTTFVLLEAMRQIDESTSHALAKAPAIDDDKTREVASLPSDDPYRGQPTQADLPRTKTPLAAPAPPGLGLPRTRTPHAQLPSLAKPAQPSPPASEWREPPSTVPNAKEQTPSEGRPKPVSGLGVPVHARTGGGDGDTRRAAVRDTLENPRPAVGDGIDFAGGPGSTDAGRDAIDDATLREVGLASRQRAFRQQLELLWKRTKPVLVDAGRTVVANARTGSAAAARAVEPLRPKLAKLHPKLGAIPPLAVLGASTALLLAVLFFVAAVVRSPRPGLAYDDAVRLVQRGKADVVVAALQPASVPKTPAQQLALGDACAALRDGDCELAAYAQALPGGAVDGIAAASLLSRLDASEPDDEMDLLVLWPDFSIDESLELLALDVKPMTRQNAIAVLVERGALSRIDVEQTAMLELLPRTGSCTTRTAAMRALTAAGKSRGALDVVDRVGRAQDSCFQTADLSAAYKAIKRRL